MSNINKQFGIFFLMCILGFIYINFNWEGLSDDQLLYKEELIKAEKTCSKTISDKFQKELNRYEIKKNTLFGHKDGILGQLGFNGSNKKIKKKLMKNSRFQWYWILEDSPYIIRCFIFHNGNHYVDRINLSIENH